MPHYTTTRQVHHSATDMFDLVADIESYPRFLPLCESLGVWRYGRGKHIRIPLY